MKQRNLLIAAAALAIVGCTNDESATTAALSTFDSKAINFSSNTTRASVVTLATLETDGNKFKVFATSGDNPTSWYTDGTYTINGEYNYVYSEAASDWAWSSISPAWPTATTGYPMRFLAVYPSSITTSEAKDELTEEISLNSEITIEATSADQVDIMTALSTTNAKPADGHLALCFKHILSRLNFSIVAGNGVTVELQRITVNNVGNKGKYSHDAQAWTDAPDEFASDYTYVELVEDDKFTTTGKDETVENAAFVSEDDNYNYLMLMPQIDAPEWDPAKMVSGDEDVDDMTGAYIEVIYRYEAPVATSSIGYSSYTEHPNYIADPDNEAYDKYKDNDDVGETALYIRVAYPLDAAWEIGNAYSYNIGLGTLSSSNGYLIDDVYYDKNGDPTDFPIDLEDIKPGDPVSSDRIDFTVSICNEWVTVTESLN
ncbi:MAG: fimbrillin family protein [Rikenellaceae bacterium]